MAILYLPVTPIVTPSLMSWFLCGFSGCSNATAEQVDGLSVFVDGAI